MIKSSSREEDKDIQENVTKDVRNIFRLEEENKGIKDKITRDIGNRFEHDEEENYHKLVRIGNFRSSNYSEYKSKRYRKTLLVKKIS